MKRCYLIGILGELLLEVQEIQDEGIVLRRRQGEKQHALRRIVGELNVTHASKRAALAKFNILPSDDHRELDER